MFRLFPKALLLVSTGLIVFAAAVLSVAAQCGGVYFKPTVRKILAERVVFDGNPEFYKDVTGDGKTDLVGFLYEDSAEIIKKIYILPGTGSGGFGTPKIVTFPAEITSPYFGNTKILDYNSDGKNDLIVRLNTSPKSVGVYLNDGSGNFTAQNLIILPENENIVNIVDVNTDGRRDFITYNYSNQLYYYRLSNADGSLNAGVQIAPAAFQAAADFNGDGKIDFPATTGTAFDRRLQIYYNLGGGVFSLGNNMISVGSRSVQLVKDFNNDGKPDLLLSDFPDSGVSVAINQGNDTFSYTGYATSSRSSMVGDFNGDGFSDIHSAAYDSVTPYSSSKYTIVMNNGVNGGFTSQTYNKRSLGIPVGDFDGDNKTDLLQFSNFNFPNNAAYSKKVFDNETQISITGNVCNSFGQTKIVDFDGDGLTDTAFWNPNNGRWRYQQSNSPNTNISVNWGQSGDVPVPGDYDGDGKTDIAVYRPATGSWYVIKSADNSPFGIQFGASEDKPVPGDYNGDGKTDFAVYRPSTGSWYVLYNGTYQFYGAQFGASEDRPVPEDYDGDGKTDFAVFRPSNGVWYVLRSSDNSYFGVQWGFNTDTLAPADYDGDGQADIAVMRPGATYYWYIRRSNNLPSLAYAYGTTGDIPQVGDWDGNGIWDLGIYRPGGTKYWYSTASIHFSITTTFAAETGEIPVSSLNKSY